MSCFPCFTSQKSKKSSSRHDDIGLPPKSSKSSTKDRGNQGEDKHINAQTFNFRELATATNNFRQECLLGEGGFGRVYKGTLKTSGQVVAVKQLDRNGLQGNKEFLAEVSTLSLLHHPNLVNLIGYCADGEQRLLVFEYMPSGSLEDHLLDITPDKNPLDWYTRIKIAFGIATGLEYLHETAKPAIIYRDLKSSNVLLDDDLNPKLSDFGGGKLGPPGDKPHVSSRVMGTYGYSAPEYTRTGQLTLKSDIYSYGVVLLELITGRRAIDTTRPNDEQNLVTWAQPFFRDPKKFPELADPLLAGQFPEKDLNQAVAIAAMCLQDEATVRPLITDVVMTLSFLSTKPPPEPVAPPPASPHPSQDGNNEDKNSSKHHKAGSQSSGDSVSEGSEAPGDSGSEGSGSDSGAGSEEDEESNNAGSKKWQPERGGSGMEDEGSESESPSGSGSGRGSMSSRESNSGSNRLEAGPGEGGVVSYRRKKSGGKEKSMSRRTTRVGPTEPRSGKCSQAVSRNNSDVSLGMMSACHEQSFSLGSQDGFVSLQNISNMGSLDGSVHSSR